VLTRPAPFGLAEAARPTAGAPAPAPARWNGAEPGGVAA
jgi:hypothetical protein